MENLLRNGDYVPDGFGGFVRLRGAEKTLARALFCLTCKRGAMVFLPELGSRLYALGKEKSANLEQVAEQYCAEALAPLGVEISKLQLRVPTKGQAVLELWLEYDGETRQVEVNL